MEETRQELVKFFNKMLLMLWIWFILYYYFALTTNYLISVAFVGILVYLSILIQLIKKMNNGKYDKNYDEFEEQMLALINFTVLTVAWYNLHLAFINFEIINIYLFASITFIVALIFSKHLVNLIQN